MLTLTAAINNSKLNNFLILDLYYRQLRARIEAINRRENFFFFYPMQQTLPIFFHFL